MSGIKTMDLRTTLRRRVTQALVGSTLLAAIALTAPWAEAQGHGPAHGGGPGIGMPMMFAGSPEQVTRRVDRLLEVLNANEAQRGQVRQIVDAAAADLRAQRGTVRELRERGLQIFTAPTVDAAAAESVRQQLQVQHDDASRRMLQAMLDLSRVLTPEQRAQMGALMKQHHAAGQQHGSRGTARQ